MRTESCQQKKRNGLIRRSSLAIAGAMSISVLLLNPGPVQANAPITPSGLNTQVHLSATPPTGKVQYDITDGTRAGTNLFHSFGQFGVPPNNIANFLNDSGLATSNILARVTGNIRSDIFGTIQTTNFGGAHLFLMNPAGILFGPGATLSVGGMVTFTTAAYIRLNDNARFNAVAGPADALLSTEPVAAFGFLTSSPASIQIQQTQLFVNGQTISLVGGDIEINGEGVGGGIAAPNGRIEIASVASPGEVVRTPQGLNVDAFAQLGTVRLTNNAVLDVGDFNGTGAGAIRIRGGHFLMDQSRIGADTFGDVGGSPVGIDIGVRNDAVLQNSTISSTTQGGLGRASDIMITASSVLVDNVSVISSSSFVPGPAGNITLTVGQLTVTGGGKIQAGALGPGRAGSITINGTESVTVSGNFGGDPALPSLISTQSQSPTENAGPIAITTPSLTIMDGARVESNSLAAGRGGDVVLNVHNLTMSGGAQIETSSQPFFVSPEVPKGSGDIHVNATQTISLSGAGTGLFSETNGAGQAGTIDIHAGALQVSTGALITSSSRFGPFGGTPTGNAGTITVQGLASPAQSVVIDGTGSGIFTETQGSGAGGNIVVNANSVTLQNGGTLSAKTSGTEATATGGSITVTATNQVAMTGGASITASSTGPGIAGNIQINAGQQLEMRDSSIKTEAAQASGGNIDIQAIDRVRLVNSAISTSVRGGRGSGGNITIDPNTVILQNSQIIAQAVQGAGGNITITTPLFLADQTSHVSASSQFGLNGTVTIQSPTSNLSGSVGSLPSSMRQQPALQAQRCAALYGGASSSFLIAGRDTIPTEPGGWLASPLGLQSLGRGPLAETTIDEPRPTTLVMTQTSEPISLRRLTPAGFLTQRFAGNGSDGCRS